VAAGSNWSDGKKWFMGIVAALIVATLVAKINRTPMPVIGAPQGTSLPNAAELEGKIRELEEKQKQSPSDTPAINIGGYWQAAPYTVYIVQWGNQLQMGLYNQNGTLTSSCKGNLSGNSMLVDCTTDNVHWGRYTAGLTPGTRRIELTTFTNGYAQEVVITR
jgi:hypothetical protein